jgi:hypothetical protein
MPRKNETTKLSIYRTVGQARCIFLVVLPAVCLLAACDEEKPKNVLKEAIDVQGTCREDHVQQSDEYAGQIVRWQMADRKD